MPSRIIKETICTSENLNNLDAEVEIFFYRLMVICDDFGISHATPSILRAKCFPLRIDKIKDKDIERWLQALSNANLIFIYQFEGRQYLKMTKWEKHQQKRANKSKYPTPETEGVQMISNDINGNQPQADSLVSRITRNEKRDKEPYATHVHMTENEYQKLVEEFGQELINGKIEDLNNWKGGKGKTTKDDYLTVRSWIRKDQKESAKSPNNRGKPQIRPDGLWREDDP